MNDGDSQQTRYSSIHLPKNERFVCTKRDIKNVFGFNALDWVSLGHISTQFKFESRCHHRPKINGHVVAELTIDRENKSYLCIYKIRSELYSDEVSTVFCNQILPKMREWLNKKNDRTETAIVGNYENLIVEWVDEKHIIHEIRW